MSLRSSIASSVSYSCFCSPSVPSITALSLVAAVRGVIDLGISGSIWLLLCYFGLDANVFLLDFFNDLSPVFLSAFSFKVSLPVTITANRFELSYWRGFFHSKTEPLVDDFFLLR